VGENLHVEAPDLRATSAVDVEVDVPPEGKRRLSRTTLCAAAPRSAAPPHCRRECRGEEAGGHDGGRRGGRGGGSVGRGAPCRIRRTGLRWPERRERGQISGEGSLGAPWERGWLGRAAAGRGAVGDLERREEAGGGGCRGNIGRVQSGRGRLLTPKIGTGKRLTCGPSLVGEYHSARCFPQSIR
jgi:hypothetical protein